MSIRKLMTKVNLESEAEETVGATEEDILDVIESDEITADLVEASKEANDAAEADQELTDLAEEVTETIGDIEEKLEDTAEVEPEDVAVAQESLRHYKKMLGIKDEGTKISLESMRNDTKANLENIKVELEGVLDTIKDSAKKVWDWIISIFNKIKDLFKAGYAKIAGFFKNMKWKNKPEQIKTADVINKEVAKGTGVEIPYINNKVYKEVVINGLEEKITTESVKVEDIREKMKSGEVTKKEEVTGLVAVADIGDLYSASVHAFTSKYALLSLFNPVKAVNAILDLSKRCVGECEYVLATINKLADGDEEASNRIKSEIANNTNAISSISAYKYINDKCKELVRSLDQTGATEHSILIPLDDNTMLIYHDLLDSGDGRRFSISELLEKQGKTVADKYGSEEVFKAYDILDSNMSSVMRNLNRIDDGARMVRGRTFDVTTIDKDVVQYFRNLMYVLQFITTFGYDYKKYLVTTIELINKNTVNK